ncbi:MAG: CaiB/BaiF CoA transferase family protein [Gammaproteobacteria bacterium]
MAGLLEGIRVVEVATFVAAPGAGTIMGDYGADVVHVEPPGHGDPLRLLHLLQTLPDSEQPYAWMLEGRNKRSVVLDLKQAAGRDILKQLVADADVFITNYQPDVAAELEVRYADLAPLNPRLVYAHVSGYGAAGAEAGRPGYDATAWWARSGLMDLVRPRDGEVALSAPGMGDHPTALALFGAIMAALFRRERTGRGGEVATSLLASGLWANGIMAQAALCGAAAFKPISHAEAPNPLVNVYRTGDGHHLFLAMVKEAFEWELFCTAIDRPDLKDDPRFATSALRASNNVALVAILDDVFAARAASAWSKVFDRHGVTHGLVQPYEALPDDPQAAANGLYPSYVDGGGLRTVDSPISIAGETKRAPRMAPVLGQHTAEVLGEAGYDPAAIAALAADGIVVLG